MSNSQRHGPNNGMCNVWLLNAWAETSWQSMWVLTVNKRHLIYNIAIPPGVSNDHAYVYQRCMPTWSPLQSKTCQSHPAATTLDTYVFTLIDTRTHRKFYTLGSILTSFTNLGVFHQGRLLDNTTRATPGEVSPLVGLPVWQLRSGFTQVFPSQAMHITRLFLSLGRLPLWHAISVYKHRQRKTTISLDWYVYHSSKQILPLPHGKTLLSSPSIDITDGKNWLTYLASFLKRWGPWKDPVLSRRLPSAVDQLWYFQGSCWYS